MSCRARCALSFAAWGALACASVALVFGHHWLILPAVNLAGMLFCASLTCRLVLGKWLDYRPVLRLMFDRKYRERFTR